MKNIFFCSDHHFYHQNILNFKRDCGAPLREFSSVEHMHDVLIAKHNQVVKPTDRVYFLGDLIMSRNSKNLQILQRFNGKKVLIKGNHDLCKAQDYLQYFDDIRAVHQFDGLILSHIPIHTESLSRWKLNVHGHLHARRVLLNNTNTPDPRYLCVSMEQIDYTPISLDEVRKRMPT